MITARQLLTIFPHARRSEELAAAISDAWSVFDIRTQAARAAHLAIKGNETGGMREIGRERMNYSPARAFQLFPKARANPADTHDRCARGERAFASWMYAGLYGNGNEASGDGWLFRGGGMIQTTFRSAYAAATRRIGIDLVGNPDLIVTPPVAALTASWFVADFKPQILPLWDTGREDDFMAGGAMVGWTDETATARRLDYWRKALAVVDGAPARARPPRLLFKGCEPGDDVRAIQRALLALGFYRGEVDGDFGNLTLEAVKAFQKQQWPDNPHEWDGVVGKGTRGRLLP